MTSAPVPSKKASLFLLFFSVLFFTTQCTNTQEVEQQKKINLLDLNDYNRCYYEAAKAARMAIDSSKYEQGYVAFHSMIKEGKTLLKKDATYMTIACLGLDKIEEAQSFAIEAIQKGAKKEYIEKKAKSLALDLSFWDQLEPSVELLQQTYSQKRINIFTDSIRVLARADSLMRSSNVSEEVFTATDRAIRKRLIKLLESDLYTIEVPLRVDDEARLYALVLHALYYEEDADFFSNILDQLLLSGTISPKLYTYAVGRGHAARFIEANFKDRPASDAAKHAMDSLMMLINFNPSFDEIPNADFIDCN